MLLIKPKFKAKHYFERTNEQVKSHTLPLGEQDPNLNSLFSLLFRSNCANFRRNSTRSTIPRQRRRRKTARVPRWNEAGRGMRMVTCLRTVSAPMAWRRGTGTEDGGAMMTCQSWTRACSWIGPEPYCDNRP